MTSAYEGIIYETNLYATMEDYKVLKACSEKIFKTYLKGNKYDYLLCLDEVFSNCFLHAYDGKPGPINVKYVEKDKFLILIFRDFGSGISEENLKEFDSCDPMVTSGRGLYIVRNLCEKFVIKQCATGGTEITLYFGRC